MRRYRTEIVIPSDRYVGLQLPADLPEGRAIVSIYVEVPDFADLPESLLDPGLEIEWWEEFGDEAGGDEPGELRSRLNALEA